MATKQTTDASESPVNVTEMSREELYALAQRINQAAADKPIPSKADEFNALSDEEKIAELYAKVEESHQLIDQLIGFALSHAYHVIADKRAANAKARKEERQKVVAAG